MTGSSLWQFRDLILNVRDNARQGFGDEVLLPWVQQHPEVVAELRDIGRPESHTRVVGRDEFLLEGLYALSRLVDILIAPHQPVNDDPTFLSWISGQPWWRGPLPSETAWASLFTAIGATAITEDSFHPSFHEIVAVVPAEDHQAGREWSPKHCSRWCPSSLLGTSDVQRRRDHLYCLLTFHAILPTRCGIDTIAPMVLSSLPIRWCSRIGPQGGMRRRYR